jgi:hypothetical protein
MSSFDACVGSAECQCIQNLTIRYFNSFRFFGTPRYVRLRYIRLITNRNRLGGRLQDLHINLITRGYTNNVIDNAFSKALQYTQSNVLIDENQENKNKNVLIDDNSTNQCTTNEPNSNKPILMFC